MLASPQTQAPPKPPKIPTNQTSEGSERLHLAPQLPPLYQLPPINFESQPQVYQHDFAYQQSNDSKFSQVSSQTPSGRTGSSQNTPKIHDTRFPLETPSKEAGSFSPKNDPVMGRASPSRPCVSIPTNNSSQNNAAESHAASGSAPGTRHGVSVNTPDQQVGPHVDTTEDSNASFYWHSPQSSNGTAQDEKEEEENLSSKKTSDMAEAKFSLSSASVLGFGGPSDWEHFGDYDAEEIDDEDLYTSSKPKTAELPASTSPLEALQGQIGDSRAIDDTINMPTQSKEYFIHQKQQIEQQIAIDGEAEAEVPEAFTTNSEPHDSPTSEHHPLPSESVPATIVSVDPSGFYDSSATERNQSLYDLEDRSNLDHQLEHDDGEQLAPVIYSEPIDAVEKDTTHIEQEEHQMQTKEIYDEDAATDADGTDRHEHVEEDHDTIRSPFREDESLHAQSKEVNEKNHTESNDIGTHQVDEQLQHKPSLGNRGSVDDGAEDIIISLQIPGTEPSPPFAPKTLQKDAKPLDENNKANTPKSALLSPMKQESSEAGRPERRSIFPKSIEMDDPYANLDPWAKASLNRYVKMLHEESQLERDEDKYLTFMNFIQRETKLRAVLYDIEDDPEPAQQTTKHKPLKGSMSILTLRPSIKSKALPALPPDANTARPPMRLETASRSPGKIDTPCPRKTEDKSKQVAVPAPSQDQGFAPHASSDESYVLVDSPSTEQQYTPGGRPLRDNDRNNLKTTPSLTSLRKALHIVAGVGSSSESRSPRPDGAANSAANEGRDPKQIEATRSDSIPIPAGSGMANASTTKVSEKPQYIPFNYNEGRAYEGDKASNRQSIYQPFAELLRQGSQRHTSIDGGANNAVVSNGSGNEVPDVPTIGSRISGFGHGVMKFPSPIATPDIVPTKRTHRYTILEPLLVVVPQRSVLRPEPQSVLQLRQDMDAVPDDFSFIHKTVVAWDAEAKKSRERYERERHARQTESEQRIDALFNDNEIGYGDINELETEFKRTEASKKAEEDRAEFQSFVSKVFDVVWARLHYEMDQLAPLYDTCTRMVINASAGKEMFDDSDSHVPIAPAMDCLLILHQKLAIRYQKAFEAVVERDRRLKKTEVAPWYALGNIAKVKKLEKRFEDAEKKAILEFCRQRDERANLLMDVLDQNTLRGVGENQDYMESVMQAVRKIAMDVALSGLEADTDGPISTAEILKAKTITSALAKSSEQIVQTFHVADMLLNEADYEVSVANAKMAGADAASFKRLREAKGMEDLKLVKDLEHRMSLIRGDSSRTHDEIGKLLALVGGVEDVVAEGVVDRERETRLRRALEEAKRRNGELGG